MGEGVSGIGEKKSGTGTGNEYSFHFLSNSRT